MPKVGTRTINNVEVEIHADGRSGTWQIMLPPDEEDGRAQPLGGGNTIEAAVNNARTSIKRMQTSVRVPFKNDDGDKGFATGRHARSRDKILTEIGGKKVHISYRDQTFKADTPQDVFDHLNEIETEIRKLMQEKRTLIKEWELNLGTAVDKAVEEATKDD